MITRLHEPRRALGASAQLIRPIALASMSGLLALTATTAPVGAAHGIDAQLVGRRVLVTGTSSADTILLELVSGTLYVDAAADGSVEFTFDRSRFEQIGVEAGAGDDTVLVGPSDLRAVTTRVDGGAGKDTLAFDGRSGPGIIPTSAGDGRMRLARNLGSIVMDLDAIERIDLRTPDGTGPMIVDATAGDHPTQVIAVP